MKQFKSKLIAQHWKEYFFSFIVLSILGALPGIMFGANVPDYFYPYGIFYLIYWGIIAIIFTFLTIYQKKKAFDEPLKILKDATSKVASGDFSVYLKPIFSLNQTNYINQMFSDFNKMVAELGSLETMKTDFIANVSHEIKTPLANIQGYARMLQGDKITPEERTTYANSLMMAANNLSTLVTNILQLSKLENQGIISSVESFNVSELIREVVASFIDAWEDKGIQYHIDIEDYATIFADPTLIIIIIRNLLSNATKFTDYGQSISIIQTSTSDKIKVIVSDTGIGMNQSTIKHLFEKFYQGDTSRSVEGNGLGMALVARSIVLLNGTIDVKSEPNKGTTFTIILNAQYF